MSEGLERVAFKHGLSFIAVLAFVASFFGSRIFAILFPNIVVVNGGIHFHHFWYGIAMISISGWVGITWQNDRLDRILALTYGLGAGFIGDEVGLLLTLGNYESELTYEFFVGALSFVVIVMLTLQYGDQLKRDVLHLSIKERLTHIGIFIVGFSSIFFAFGRVDWGIPVAIIGVAVFLFGFELRHRLNSLVKR